MAPTCPQWRLLARGGIGWLALSGWLAAVPNP
jgi:hypothetical protein